MNTIGKLAARKLSSADSSSDRRLQTYCRSCSVSLVFSSLLWRWMVFRCVRMRAKLSSIMAVIHPMPVDDAFRPADRTEACDQFKVGRLQRSNRRRERFVSRSTSSRDPIPQPGQPHMRAGLMPLDPAAFDRECQARSETAAGAAGSQRNGPLIGLDAASDRSRAAAFGSANGLPAPNFIPPRPDLKRSMRAAWYGELAADAPSAVATVPNFRPSRRSCRPASATAAW